MRLVRDARQATTQPARRAAGPAILPPASCDTTLRVTIQLGARPLHDHARTAWARPVHASWACWLGQLGRVCTQCTCSVFFYSEMFLSSQKFFEIK